MPHKSEQTARNRPKDRQRRLSKFVGRISKIKPDELSDRQLRAARRLANKKGLATRSDHDAVEQLKALVHQSKARRKTPPLISDRGQAQPLQFNTLHDVATDLKKRRSRRMRQMVLRLSFLVLLPGLLASGYFFFVATPMYATYTELVVQKSDSGSAAAGLGLLGALPSASVQENASVQGFLSSRVAMMRLFQDQDFRTTLTDPSIDRLQRLPHDASNEDAFKLYTKRVKIGFDPNDNVIKMEVIAPSPQQSLDAAKSLITMAEVQVDQMSQRLRQDRMRGARDGYDAAEVRLAAAQDKALSLQQAHGVLSAELEASTKMGQITSLQTALQQKQLELETLRDNPQPNRTRLSVLENSIARHETLIEGLRDSLISDSDKSASLARIGAELMAAQGELELRQTMVSQSLQLMEAARVEANRQSVFLATSVAPVLPDKPVYPKAVQNSALSFLLLGGLYLLVSLTFSILREQISS